MTKNYTFKTFLVVALFSVATSFGQVTTINFEEEGDGYNVPAQVEGSSFTDVFNRFQANFGGNSTYVWGIEDTNLSNPSLTLSTIDVTNATSFTFSLDLLAHHYNDWDNVDEVLITYSVDGGTPQNLMSIQSITDPNNAFNEPAAIDKDFDGSGECDSVLPALSTGTGATGCEVTSNVFENFTTSSISLDGNSTLDIIIQFNGFTATDEGLYMDNIVIDVETPALSTDAFNQANVKVYPNPVRDGKIFIQTPSAEVKDVKIYNVLGRRVLATKVNAGEEINVSNLSTGMYMLSITENQKTLTKKIVIE